MPLSNTADRPADHGRSAARPLPSAPLALTMGEPAGIGPDITLIAWHGRQKCRLPPFAYMGCPRVLADRAAQLGLDVEIAEITGPEEATTLFAHALPVLPQPCVPVAAGKPVAESADAVIAAIRTAVHLAQAGKVAAVVTNPIAKSVLTRAGFPYPGHTEYLGHLARTSPADQQPRRAVMMLASAELKVVPVTVHVPLTQVPELLTADLVFETGTIVARELTRRFGLNSPRIAVSGLNPHAGEDGTIGVEETEIIIPAIERLRRAGIDVSGPWPADSMFHETARRTYDAALCMYHDQALIPIKTVAFDRAVNVTLGLDFIRTSPDHGTAFDIAGSGRAQPASLIEALNLAARMGHMTATDQPAPAPSPSHAR